MDASAKMERFRKFCTGLAWAAGAMAAGFIAVAAFMWLHSDYAEWIAREQWAGGDAGLTLTPSARAAAAALSCAHLALLCWAFWTARGMFLRFARDEVLEAQTGRDLRMIGGLVAAYAALTPVVKTLLTLVLTVGNPPGQRLFAVAFGTSELILGVLGALILVLGHVMAEAARIADDNRQIV